MTEIQQESPEPKTDLEYIERSMMEFNNILQQHREIAKLLNDDLEAGTHTVKWNGANTNGREVASGIYFYRIEAGQNIATKKMLLVK